MSSRETALCSVGSNDRLAHARVLFSSVAAQHKDADLYLFLADELNSEVDRAKENFEIIEAKELSLQGLVGMSFMYDGFEFGCSLKPFIVRHLLAAGYKKVVYLDTDIRVFGRLDLVLELLDTHSFVVTPHITEPISSGELAEILEHRVLVGGTFNAGFFASARTPEAFRFLDWWAQKCRTSCFREAEKGLFVDQKWLDFAPSFLADLAVLKHRGCNIAHWNLHERAVSGAMVNGSIPLVFFHFSGFEVDDPYRIFNISKPKDWYSRDDGKGLAEIVDGYKEFLLSSGYEQCRAWRHRYDYFDNGVKIGRLARRFYPAVAEDYPDPFSVKDGSYYQMLKGRGLLGK